MYIYIYAQYDKHEYNHYSFGLCKLFGRKVQQSARPKLRWFTQFTQTPKTCSVGGMCYGS